MGEIGLALGGGFTERSSPYRGAEGDHRSGDRRVSLGWDKCRGHCGRPLRLRGRPSENGGDILRLVFKQNVGLEIRKTRIDRQAHLREVIASDGREALLRSLHPIGRRLRRLVSGELVVVRSGEIAEALRASIAIPGVLAPVERDDQLLVDGYVLNNNPADIVKKMGASYVVAVEVSRLPEQRTRHVFSHLSRYISIASRHMTAQQLRENADLSLTSI